MNIITRHRSSGYTYDQVRIPLLLRGSINRTVFAGHMRSLGIEIGWNGGPNKDWADAYYISFWGLVAFHYEETKNGTLKSCHPGLEVRWCKLVIKKSFYRARVW